MLSITVLYGRHKNYLHTIAASLLSRKLDCYVEGSAIPREIKPDRIVEGIAMLKKQKEYRKNKTER